MEANPIISIRASHIILTAIDAKPSTQPTAYVWISLGPITFIVGPPI